jgi:hypothetical protein
MGVRRLRQKSSTVEGTAEAKFHFSVEGLAFVENVAYTLMGDISARQIRAR